MRRACTIAATADRIFVGQFDINSAGSKEFLGINSFDFQKGTWQDVKKVEGLPSLRVSTLMVDGANLWVGGMGYVALVDPNNNEVRKFAYVHARTVDQIQIGGGYVWAKYNWHLHRVSVRDL